MLCQICNRHGAGYENFDESSSLPRIFVNCVVKLFQLFSMIKIIYFDDLHILNDNLKEKDVLMFFKEMSSNE